MKLEEGGAYGVVITDNQKPSEKSGLSVHVGHITTNVIVRYINYQSNSPSY